MIASRLICRFNYNCAVMPTLIILISTQEEQCFPLVRKKNRTFPWNQDYAAAAIPLALPCSRNWKDF